MASVVVVGAGLSGLACAFQLVREGVDVELLEREANPGGRIRTERRDGVTLERGAPFVAGDAPHLRALAHEAGLAASLEAVPPRGDAVLRGGRFAALEARGRGWPGAALLGAASRLRLPRIGIELWRNRASLDPQHPAGAAALDTTDLASWLTALAGDDALETLFAPAFASAFACEPEEIGAAFAQLTMRSVARSPALVAFRGGNESLPRALADACSVRFGWEALAIEADPLGVQVHFVTPSGERSQRAEAVVLAVPGPAIAALCPTLPVPEREFFRTLSSVRGATVHLRLPQAPRALPGLRAGFTRGSGVGLFDVVAAHALPGACPDGEGLLRVTLRTAEAERLWEAKDDDVAAFALAELARTPLGTLSPSAVFVHRHDPRSPALAPGSLRALRRFEMRADRSRRLAFAGDWRLAPTVEGAIASGLRAAAEIRSAL